MIHRTGNKCSQIRIRDAMWGDFELNGCGGHGIRTDNGEGECDSKGLEVHVVACLIL